MLVLLAAVIMQISEQLKFVTNLRIRSGENVFIVRLEHPILYPECINTKTNTAISMCEWYEMGVKSFVLCCYENEP